VPAVLDGVAEDDNESNLKFDDAIARFHDPLGLVGPVITKSNIFVQQLCKEKLSWDESLPESHNTEGNAICQSFGQISHASFPFFVLSPNAESEIYEFCDASIEAYGVCVCII